ncbi:hypothetical protein DAPPUDRAFT_113326 [Daphnia pulex]|uniref:Uncharacterized protein n=1 Tax=Daphnia pulex TaxID=6669 RepID=E9HEQ7_DAPPU|nr:hypothetical protein DAPPUDRAFT_113326 [Daphnia pulex]|eukprot:EFX69798.1 hypothetical protein DAPPUDRAFT_113326 [Daphnia pulex]
MDNYLLRRAKTKSRLKEVQTKDEALTKIQLKIMDIAPPLIELAARMRSFSDGQTEEPSPMEARIKRTVEASLQQWGRAYANITKLRREAYVKKVEPHLEFLLEEKSAFAEGKEARELLFTTFSCHVSLRKRKMTSHLMRLTELLRPRIPLHSEEAGENQISVRPATVRLLANLLRADAARASAILVSKERKMDFRGQKIISATTEGMCRGCHSLIPLLCPSSLHLRA